MIKLNWDISKIFQSSKTYFFDIHRSSKYSIIEGRRESYSEQITAQLPIVPGKKLERLIV